MTGRWFGVVGKAAESGDGETVWRMGDRSPLITLSPLPVFSPSAPAAPLSLSLMLSFSWFDSGRSDFDCATSGRAGCSA